MSLRALSSATRPLAHRALFRNSSSVPPFSARTLATAIDSREFVFPPGTRHRATDRQQGLEKSADFAEALRNHGILAIDMGFEDPSSSFILEIVEAMGCQAQAHSRKDGPLWDITWKPSGTVTDPSGKPTSNVWSHSLDEMSWHTDGSFEHHPMPFFGFHILRSDHEGGGRFRILKAEEIASKLSPRAWQILTTKEFHLRVPPEFMKKVGHVKGKLLRVDPDTGYIHLRYRSSVVKDPPSDDSEANEAVRELQTLLHHAPDSIGQTVSPNVFKDNSILLMNNSRFLHSRTTVNDPQRFLRRVRFDGTPGKAEQPAEQTAINDDVDSDGSRSC